MYGSTDASAQLCDGAAASGDEWGSGVDLSAAYLITASAEGAGKCLFKLQELFSSELFFPFTAAARAEEAWAAIRAFVEAPFLHFLVSQCLEAGVGLRPSDVAGD